MKLHKVERTPKISQFNTINHRPFMKDDYMEIIPIPPHLEFIAKLQGFNKCAKIVYHGVPVPDERPRLGPGGRTYIPNAALLSKMAHNLIEVSEVAKRTTITSFYSMSCDFYLPITSTVMKYIKSDPKLLKKYYNEQLECITVKDVDNLTKSHNDIMFVYHTYLVVNDTFNTSTGYIRKLFSENPRAVVYILFTDKPSSYQRWSIERSAGYYTYKLSYKYILTQYWDDIIKNKSKIIKHLTKTVADKYGTVKDREKLKSVIGTIFKVINASYPANALKELVGEVENRNFNKENAIHKLLYIIFKDNPLALSILNGIKDLGEFEKLEFTSQNIINTKSNKIKIDHKPKFYDLKVSQGALAKEGGKTWTHITNLPI